MIINERDTFLDKLNNSHIGSSFNIYSGSKNYKVTQVGNDKFEVIPGKGYDKGSDAYINKCYIRGINQVTRNALTNFIKMINRKNGYREDIDVGDLGD